MPSQSPPESDLESPPEPSDRRASAPRDRGPRPPLFAGAEPPTAATDPERSRRAEGDPSSPADPQSPPDGLEGGSGKGSRRRRKLGGRDRAESGATRSTGSAPKPAKVDKRQLRAAIDGGVGVASHQLHALLCRDDDERAVGLWLADEQDRAGLAEPMANIAARRSGPELANPDLLDAVAALIALVGYVSKQLSLRARIRQLRVAGLPTEPGTGEAAAAASGGDPAAAAAPDDPPAAPSPFAGDPSMPGAA